MNKITSDNKESSGQGNGPDGLFEKILIRIDEERLMRAKRRIVLICAGLIASVGALVPAFYWLRASFADSGSTQLLSLAFSDSSVMLADWRDFSIALLESLPILDIIAFLGIMLVVLQLLAFVAKDWEKITKQKPDVSLRGSF